MPDSYEEGKRLAKGGDFEGALSHLEQATRENPESPDVWLALAACYFRVDRNDDFREAVRKSLAIDPDHAPTLRFLKKTTGAEVIPAPDTGREKIYMEAGETFQVPREEEEPSKSGCFALLCLGIGFGLFGKILVDHLDSLQLFRLY